MLLDWHTIEFLRAMTRILKQCIFYSFKHESRKIFGRHNEKARVDTGTVKERKLKVITLQGARNYLNFLKVFYKRCCILRLENHQDGNSPETVPFARQLGFSNLEFILGYVWLQKIAKLKSWGNVTFELRLHRIKKCPL